MPTSTKELVEKNNAIIRMNKAKAYRELQRRQGRLIRKVWNEASSATPSYESSLRYPAKSAVTCQDYQHRIKMVESGSIQGSLFAGGHIGASLFTINKGSGSRQRPISRVRLSSGSRDLYAEQGRPVTAPETNAYATLDGPRQEAMVIPFYPKASSVRSNNSETQSLNGFNNRCTARNRTLRQSVDLGQSIDCNNNGPLKPRNQNEPVGGAIQYPSASKMREMLATDSQMPLEKPVTETGSRSIMKRGSQISLSSKLSIQQPSAWIADPRSRKHSAISIHQNTGTEAIQRVQQANISRKPSQGKQVSFVDGENPQQEKITTRTVIPAEPEEKLLALTTKNLNTYNAMVLKTLRTAKFDERIVQWVNERQCNHPSQRLGHDAIPEVEEISYTESQGRTTPKRNHRGGTTPTDIEKTICIVSQTPEHSENTRHLNVKPTSLATGTASHHDAKFSYTTDKPSNTGGGVTGNTNHAQTEEESTRSDNMSAKTDSDPKRSSEIPNT